MARVPARQEIYNTHSGLTRGGGGVSLGSGGGVVQANAQAGLSGVMDAALRAGGKLLEIGAREYVDEQRGRVEDAVLRAGVRFERWKQAYNEAHQGGQALGARDAYVAAWQEIAGEEIRNFQGRPNERFGHDLEREMVKKGLFALRDGGNYEAAQREAWRGSQLEGQLASFEILCANDPMDQAAIDIGYRDALQSWRQKNPGLDDTAFRAKLDNIAFQTRLDNLLASNRLDDAEKLLASYERGMAGVAEQGPGAGQGGQGIAGQAGRVRRSKWRARKGKGAADSGRAGNCGSLWRVAVIRPLTPPEIPWAWPISGVWSPGRSGLSGRRPGVTMCPRNWPWLSPCRSPAAGSPSYRQPGLLGLCSLCRARPGSWESIPTTWPRILTAACAIWRPCAIVTRGIRARPSQPITWGRAAMTNLGLASAASPRKAANMPDASWGGSRPYPQKPRRPWRTRSASPGSASIARPRRGPAAGDGRDGGAHQ